MFLKRRLLYFASCGLAVGALAAIAGPSATPDDEVERYTHLIDDIHDFERFSNVRINDLIFAGLHSDNPKVVDLTIAAMHRELQDRSQNRYGYFVNCRNKVPCRLVRKRGRDIVRVPGIRDFLIDYVRDEFEQMAVSPLDSYQRNDRNFVFKMFSMLTTYFPGDSKVRRLLRDTLADHTDADHYIQMTFLNEGLFVDEEADDLRLTLLTDSDPVTAGAAARGLAMSHSDEGLRAMAQALRRWDEALPEIAAAMATYGAPAAPYLVSLLGPDTGVGELPSHLRESLAHIVAQVGRLADADAVHMAGAPQPTTPNDAGGPGAGGALEVSADIMHLRREHMPIVTGWWNGEKKMSLDFALQFHNEFPERRVLDAVFDGLRSDAAAVVERTLLAVGSYADLIAQRDWPDYADPAHGGKLRERMDARTR